MQDGVEAWLDSQLVGPIVRVDRSWADGVLQVWLVTCPAGRYYLKQYPEPRKFQTEVTAYESWAAQLDFTPRQIASDPDLRLLLISEVPGEPVSQLSVDEDTENCIHFKAGRYLRRLHELPHGDQDTISIQAALQRRAENWCDRGRTIVDSRVIEWVLASSAPSSTGTQTQVSRVPCHRDYTPRNWTYHRASRSLSVIDFEHARADDPLVDFVKLYAGPWHSRPSLQQEFFCGYGRELSADERLRLHAHAAVWALGSVVWARQHQDAGLEAQGRKVLGWLPKLLD